MIVRNAIFAALSALGLHADVAQGEIFYAEVLAADLNLSRAAFAKMHTESQWQTLFADGAAGFKREFLPKLGEEARRVLQSDFFGRSAADLEDFVRFYALDKPDQPVAEGGAASE